MVRGVRINLHLYDERCSDDKLKEDKNVRQGDLIFAILFNNNFIEILTDIPNLQQGCSLIVLKVKTFYELDDSVDSA